MQNFLKLFNMSDKTYDILKGIALVVLPTIATLYAALAGIWGFPYGQQIVATISAIDAALGAILGISTSQYNKTKIYTPKSES